MINTNEKQTDIIQELSVSSDIHTDTHKYKYDKEKRDNRLKRKISIVEALTILCSGFALISDGYQNNVMSMLNIVLTKKYPVAYTSSLKTKLSYASTVGTIFGQVLMGLAADYLGRKWSIVAATLFLILGTIMCAAAHGKSIQGLLWMLIISRGVTGFGIGAEYPSSSVSASEAANESVKRRGMVFVLVTNFPLSFGGPLALCIFLIVYQITKNLNAIWRTMFAIGAFFPLSVFYFRYRMATSVLYKQNAIVNQRVPYILTVRYYWKRLIGTCVAWFLYDFVTFPNGVFSSGIILLILGDNPSIERIAEWNLLLTAIALPGVFLGAFVLHAIGRKYTLIGGFMGYIIFGLIVGCGYTKIKGIIPLFVVFYGLMQSSGNFGPGNCMGLISSELYASPIRGTFYGFSAAIGKVGAVIGTLTFTPIQNNLGDRWTFIIAAICGLVGVLVVLIFVPSMSDDDLLEEDVKYKNYLVEHGWKGHFGLPDAKNESSEESDLEVETVSISKQNL